MLKRITHFSLRNGVAIVIVAVLLTAGGIWSAGQLKKETMPDVSIPYVTIATVYPGAAPSDIYDDVTAPLEKAVRGVAGIKRVEATSSDSVSVIVAEFGYSQDMDKTEQDVRKVAESIKLPDSAQVPEVSRVGLNTTPAITLAVGSSVKDPEKLEALRAKVRGKVADELKGIEGVGKVDIVADSPAEIHIDFDQKKLKEKGLTAAAIVQQLQAANLSYPVGSIDFSSHDEPVRLSGSFRRVQDVKNFEIAIYPDQTKLYASAFKQMGTGMQALGSGMQQGFSKIGGVTGEVALQAGMLDGIQQVQAQMYSLKFETLPELKTALAQLPKDSAEYKKIESQIEQIQNSAIPGMQSTILKLQKKIKVSQQSLSAQSSTKSNSSSHSTSSSKQSSSSVAKIETVRLQDIAKVTYASSDGFVGTRSNGKSAILISVIKSADANTVDVSKAVKSDLPKIKSLLPKGTLISTVSDESTAINESVNGMLREGLLGALFAVIVILIFLRDWRATIIATTSIPLSMLIAMIMLKQFGVTLNIMTLGGLTVAVGRVVDDAIVVIENIYRHLERGDEPGASLIENAISEVGGAIASSTLTTVAVFLPMGLVSGIVGKVFMPFALTVGLSLLASLLVALTIVPLLAKWFLMRGPKAKKPQKPKSRLVKAYESALSWSLSHRAVVVLSAVLLLVGSLALGTQLGTGFLPDSSYKAVQVSVAYPAGTKASEVDKTVSGIEKVMAKSSDIAHYESTIGASSTGGSLDGGANLGSVMGELKSGVDADKTMRALQNQLKIYETENVKVQVSKVSSTPGNSNLQVVITGNNLADIKTSADKVQKLLKHETGLANVESNLGDKRKQVVVTVNQHEAAKRGVLSGSLGQEIRPYVAEQNVGTIKLAAGDTNMVYGINLSKKDQESRLASLKTVTPLGKSIRLDQVASIEEMALPTSVLTRDGEEYAAVSATMMARDSGGVIKKIKTDLQTLELPAGVHTEMAGASEQMNDSFGQLGIAMVIAIGAIYLVMVLAFGEAIAPLAIMFSLPLAIVGGVLGLWFMKLPLDMAGMIGALMLIGIVVTNAIVLIDRVLKNQHKGLSRHDALIEAGSTRMRPIFMTAIATVSALIPLAAGAAEGAIIGQTLAIVVIGGLTTSTLLTLFIVPVAYDLLEGLKSRFGDKTHANGEIACAPEDELGDFAS